MKPGVADPSDQGIRPGSPALQKALVLVTYPSAASIDVEISERFFFRILNFQQGEGRIDLRRCGAVVLGRGSCMFILWLKESSE
jgi:hypothetical protein